MSVCLSSSLPICLPARLPVTESGLVWSSLVCQPSLMLLGTGSKGRGCAVLCCAAPSYHCPTIIVFPPQPKSLDVCPLIFSLSPSIDLQGRLRPDLVTLLFFTSPHVMIQCTRTKLNWTSMRGM